MHASMNRRAFPYRELGILLLLVNANCFGEDLLTVKGQKYIQAVVIEDSVTHLKFRHADGITKIPKGEISQESAKAFGVAVPQKADAAASAHSDLLTEIKKKMSEIKTKDGRVFLTKDLREVEPNSLKFVGDSGIAKVKFTDLPSQTADALGWNPEKAAAYEEKKSKEQAIKDKKRKEYEKAESLVESFQFEARIKPFQKVNAGWLCYVSERKKVAVEVVTGRSFSNLTGTERVFTETQEIDVTGKGEVALVWGLSDRIVASSQMAAMSSKVFLTGKYNYAALGGTKEAPIYHTDRAAAVRHLMQFGLGIVYDDDMRPGEDGKNGAAMIAFGTGFFFSKDGHIATNNHVIEGAKKITISSAGKSFEATLVATDEDRDLAILKVDYTPPANLSLSTGIVKLGDRVFTVGFPRPTSQGKNAKFTEGSVSSLTGIDDAVDQYQISVPIQPGNSGGALVNGKGHVVGIIVSTLNPLKTLANGSSLPQNVNYAVKVEHLIKLGQKNGALITQPENSSGSSDDKPKQADPTSWEQHISKTEQAAVLIRVEG